jgi:hypothetical protein
MLSRQIRCSGIRVFREDQRTQIFRVDVSAYFSFGPYLWSRCGFYVKSTRLQRRAGELLKFFPHERSLAEMNNAVSPGQPDEWRS